jgi:hypothetical protein
VANRPSDFDIPEFSESSYQLLGPDEVQRRKGLLDGLRLALDLIDELPAPQRRALGVQSVRQSVGDVYAAHERQLLAQASTPPVSDERNLFS